MTLSSRFSTFVSTRILSLRGHCLGLRGGARRNSRPRFHSKSHWKIILFGGKKPSFCFIRSFLLRLVVVAVAVPVELGLLSKLIVLFHINHVDRPTLVPRRSC